MHLFILLWAIWFPPGWAEEGNNGTTSTRISRRAEPDPNDFVYEVQNLDEVYGPGILPLLGIPPNTMSDARIENPAIEPPLTVLEGQPVFAFGSAESGGDCTDRLDQVLEWLNDAHNLSSLLSEAELNYDHDEGIQRLVRAWLGWGRNPGDAEWQRYRAHVSKLNKVFVDQFRFVQGERRLRRTIFCSPGFIRITDPRFINSHGSEIWQKLLLTFPVGWIKAFDVYDTVGRRTADMCTGPDDGFHNEDVRILTAAPPWFLICPAYFPPIPRPENDRSTLDSVVAYANYPTHEIIQQSNGIDKWWPPAGGLVMRWIMRLSDKWRSDTIVWPDSPPIVLEADDPRCICATPSTCLECARRNAPRLLDSEWSVYYLALALFIYKNPPQTPPDEPAKPAFLLGVS